MIVRLAALAANTAAASARPKGVSVPWEGIGGTELDVVAMLDVVVEKVVVVVFAMLDVVVVKTKLMVQEMMTRRTMDIRILGGIERIDLEVH